MTRRFAALICTLVATVAFLVGLVVAGSQRRAPAVSSALVPSPAPVRVARGTNPAPPSAAPAASSAVPAPGAPTFADIAERLNPAVVNVDATSRGNGPREPASLRPSDRPPRRFESPAPERPDVYDRPFDFRDRDTPRKGAGTGFVIDPSGDILTNFHVIEGADRITVRLTDGRSLRARAIGSDPDTDVALIRVDSPTPLVAAALGDSDTLRVGEWVCAIGNPLAYEHTVTVGVVSFLGRKLFDNSLDNYIQTDAAINFGNSGGPLINGRGEVVGINSAISSRASNIGFAVPINQARAVLSQLRDRGRVSRGYMGVTLRSVDRDVRRALGLAVDRGALVQDVAAESPGARAGLRPYDLIVAVDGRAVSSDSALIREIASREPGSAASLQVLRDGRPRTLVVKLAERPARERRAADRVEPQTPVLAPSRDGRVSLGVSVRDLDREFVERWNVPGSVAGVLVTRVEPMSPAYDAGLERGQIVLEVNRAKVASVEDYRRLTGVARAGDVLAFYVFDPEIDQRVLRMLRVEP